MSVTVVDGSSCLWNHIKTHDDLATLRGMVVSGADGVLEAGDLTGKILDREVDQRRDDGSDTSILAVTVQDGPETPMADYKSVTRQVVRIRLLDRAKGYRNIRNARVELMKQLKPNNFRANVADGQEVGILTTSFVERTGHLRDSALALDYEVISYELTVVRKEN